MQVSVQTPRRVPAGPCTLPSTTSCFSSLSPGSKLPISVRGWDCDIPMSSWARTPGPGGWVPGNGRAQRLVFKMLGLQLRGWLLSLYRSYLIELRISLPISPNHHRNSSLACSKCSVNRGCSGWIVTLSPRHPGPPDPMGHFISHRY